MYADASGPSREQQLREGVHKGFDKQQWYEVLFDYGIGSNNAAAPMAEDDPDGELVPQLVRKLVLPVALNMLQRCWDPSNLAQTKAAAALLGDLFVYIPAEEEKMQEVMASVVSTLEKAVSEVSVPPWPSAVASASKLAGAVQYRRFRQALRLIHGLACFEGLLSRALLLRLAVAGLAVQQCLPYLRAALATPGGSAYPLAVARLEAVAAAVPAEWFAGGPPREAGPLADHVSALARALEGQRSDKSRFPLAMRVAAAAAKMGCTDAAGRLQAAFKQSTCQ